MAKVQITSFTDFMKKAGNKKWKSRVEPYFVYLNAELLKPRDYPEFYTAEQANADVSEAMTQALDECAEFLEQRIAQPRKDGKESSVRGARKSVLADDEDSKSVEKPKPYSGLVESGNLALRTVFQKGHGNNPDFSIKDKDSLSTDDTTKWGVVRPTGKLQLEKEVLDEFESAAAGTAWLGFVRIGGRVDIGIDRLTLVQLVQEVPAGRKYAAALKEFKDGESFHASCLNRRFAAKTDPKIKRWNGWTADELKKEDRDLHSTGCFYGFFLVKADDGGSNHYYNFRCPTLNRPANAGYSDFVPQLPREKWDKHQSTVYLTMANNATSGFTTDEAEVKAAFPDVPLRRGALRVEMASKKMPMTWCKLVVEALQK